MTTKHYIVEKKLTRQLHYITFIYYTNMHRAPRELIIVTKQNRKKIVTINSFFLQKMCKFNLFKVSCIEIEKEKKNYIHPNTDPLFPFLIALFQQSTNYECKHNRKKKKIPIVTWRFKSTNHYFHSTFVLIRCCCC